MHVDIEYLVTVQNHTINTLQQLKNEIEDYIGSAGSIFSYIAQANAKSSTFEDTLAVFNIYDSYLTCLNTISGTARKYSIQLHVNNMEMNSKVPWVNANTGKQATFENDSRGTSMLQPANQSATPAKHCETKQFNSVIVNNNFTIHAKKCEELRNDMITDASQMPIYEFTHDKPSTPAQNVQHAQIESSIELSKKYNEFFDEVLKNDKTELQHKIESTHTKVAELPSKVATYSTAVKTTNPFLLTLSDDLSSEVTTSSIEQSFEETTIDQDSLNKVKEHFLMLSQRFTFTRKSLEKYTENSIFEFRVAYIDDLDELQFYVIDPYDSDMLSMVKPTIIGQYDNLPMTGEAFIVVLDDLPYRAVRSNVHTTPETVLLLELGETIELSKDIQILRIPKLYRDMPAQAMACTLHITNADNNVTSKWQLKDLLKRHLYEQVKFRIHKTHDCYLELAFAEERIEIDVDGEGITAAETSSSDSAQAFEMVPDSTTTTTEDNDDLFDVNDLSPTERAILYDEPLSTTNPMIAVMGYNPKDEKRLCQFYDPKTGSCFKGTHCKLVHMPREPNGWTKDTSLTNFISNNSIPTIMYTKGQELDITPTHIVDGTRFFAQINDENSTLHPLIWSEDEIPKTRLLKRDPLKYDLVMARYNDGNWYRAQVRDFSALRQLIKVFFLDYGNEMLLSLCDLARYDDTTALIPPQARLLNIDSVREITKTEQERSACIQYVSDKILNKNIKVKVLEQVDEDIFIGFVDNLCNLKKQLIKKGFLEQTNRLFE